MLMQQCLGNYYHRAYHAEGTWNLMYMYVIFTQQAFIQGILSEPRAFVRHRQKKQGTEMGSVPLLLYHVRLSAWHFECFIYNRLHRLETLREHNQEPTIKKKRESCADRCAFLFTFKDTKIVL